MSFIQSGPNHHCIQRQARPIKSSRKKINYDLQIKFIYSYKKIPYQQSTNIRMFLDYFRDSLSNSSKATKIGSKSYKSGKP